MCEGVKINTLKSVACSRFQTIEKFEHTTDDDEQENCSTINTITLNFMQQILARYI